MMSKTGGGRGTNQYGIRGRSVGPRKPTSGRYLEQPEPDLTRVDLPQEFFAVDLEDLPLLEESGTDLTGIEPTTTDRAIARYVSRRADHAFSSAFLEGNTFTLPQVRTLIEGVVPEGKTTDEVNQILDLTEASETLFDRLESGRFELSLDQADELNGLLARHESIAPGVRRTESKVNPDGRGATVNAMSDIFIGMDKVRLRAAETVLAERTAAIKHPVIRAVNHAALISYMQMYLDGNKRTARYLMDGELMKHGYDAIVIPVARETEYNQTLAQMFTRADPRPYARFLIDAAKDDSARSQSQS